MAEWDLQQYPLWNQQPEGDFLIINNSEHSAGRYLSKYNRVKIYITKII